MAIIILNTKKKLFVLGGKSFFVIFFNINGDRINNVINPPNIGKIFKIKWVILPELFCEYIANEYLKAK